MSYDVAIKNYLSVAKALGNQRHGAAARVRLRQTLKAYKATLQPTTTPEYTISKTPEGFRIELTPVKLVLIV